MSMSESVSQSVSDSLVTPWTVAHQAPLSMGFSRQEYWSGLTFSSLGDLPDPGIELTFLASADRLFPTEPSQCPFQELLPPEFFL